MLSPGQTFYVNTTSIDGITLGIIGVIAALLLPFAPGVPPQAEVRVGTGRGRGAS
ncbi:hypothetical protein ACU686_22790 [Yinghuangia aomiensis]